MALGVWGFRALGFKGLGRFRGFWVYPNGRIVRRSCRFF